MYIPARTGGPQCRPSRPLGPTFVQGSYGLPPAAWELNLRTFYAQTLPGLFRVVSLSSPLKLFFLLCIVHPSESGCNARNLLKHRPDFLLPACSTLNLTLDTVSTHFYPLGIQPG